MKLLRALLWLIVLFLSFYGADWSIGIRADVTVAHGVERLGFDWGGSQTLDLGVYKIPLPLVEKKYQPPTAFADQINEYQLGLTANNGTEWYGMVWGVCKRYDSSMWVGGPGLRSSSSDCP